MGKRKFALYFLISSFFILILTANLYAQANPPSISSIKDIEAVAIQGRYFKLPPTVAATLSDSKAVKVAVNWEQSTVNTSKIGDFVFKGSVKGYNKPVTLTLHVIAPIVSINNLEITIPTNSKLIPPTTVEALCNDKTVNKISVKWAPASIDTRKPGKYTLQGTVQYYSKKVRLTVTVKDLYSTVDNLNITLKQNQTFTLPSTVKAITLNKTLGDAKVTWSKSAIDTAKIGKGKLEGLVEGYSKNIFLNYEIVPVIASVPEKNITFVKRDLFSLPSNIEVTMSDGSKRNFGISWTPAQVDLRKVGTTEYLGKIEGYDKLIKWVINIKTDLKVLSKTIRYTQWNYMAIVFNKDLLPSAKLDNFILKDSDRVQIRIIEVVPGSTAKDNLLIIPSHTLDRNKEYTLTILKNTIQDVEGDLYPEDITYTFKTE